MPDRLTPEADIELREWAIGLGYERCVQVHGLLDWLRELKSEVAALCRERDELRRACLPFLRTALEIPCNWPGECVFSPRASEFGAPRSLLGYLHVQYQGQPTIADYRRLAGIEPQADGEMGDHA